MILKSAADDTDMSR